MRNKINYYPVKANVTHQRRHIRVKSEGHYINISTSNTINTDDGVDNNRLSLTENRRISSAIR